MREQFETQLQRLDFVRDLPWQDPRFYAEFLSQTYYYVCHTTRLLGLAASRIGVDREKLHHRFLSHAAEERSHHLLAQRDVRLLGYEIANIAEAPATSALYETQYHRIEHQSPTIVFGYILALEGVAVVHGPAVYQRVVGLHGDGPVSFLKLHAEDDPDHLDKAFEMVSALSPAEQAEIARNLRFSCALYSTFLAACRDAAAS
jgi:pyrroloquinoline quinone (PQQ) biosynthesis protein C